jgi:phage terminase small subunit
MANRCLFFFYAQILKSAFPGNPYTKYFTLIKLTKCLQSAYSIFEFFCYNIYSDILTNRKKVDKLSTNTRPLTEKQKHFCRNIVSGMSTKDAYLSAYNSNAKDMTIYVEASRILDKPQIQEYIETLSKPLKEKAQARALTAREEQISFIQSRIEHCISTDDEQSLIRYTDMLNKIHGIYKEETTQQQAQSTVTELDTAQLLKLVN